MKRIPPSKATKARIEELLGAGVREGSPLSELVRLSVEHIVEEVLEAKVEEILGDGLYVSADRRAVRSGATQLTPAPRLPKTPKCLSFRYG